jgi:hypothetical protein
MVNAVTMTRTAPIPRAVVLASLVLVAGLLLAAATASAEARRPSGATSSPGKPALGPGRPYDATLLSCRRGRRLELRSATVEARMRPLPNGRRMAVRVDLQQRELGARGRWTTRTDVPGLSTWTSPGDLMLGSSLNDQYVYRQAVGRLVVPYAYRFKATFRWYGADGRIVREAAMRTAVCREPDLRPDLRIVRVAVAPHPDPLLSRYVVVVRNVGRTAAARVGVAIAPADATTPPRARRTIRLLRPQESREVALVGPRCEAGAEPTAWVDPQGTVDEADEDDNALRATCTATLQRP